MVPRVAWLFKKRRRLISEAGPTGMPEAHSQLAFLHKESQHSCPQRRHKRCSSSHQLASRRPSSPLLHCIDTSGAPFRNMRGARDGDWTTTSSTAAWVAAISC
jgi:hypothetical protein